MGDVQLELRADRDPELPALLAEVQEVSLSSTAMMGAKQDAFAAGGVGFVHGLSTNSHDPEAQRAPGVAKVRGLKLRSRHSPNKSP